MTIGLEAHKSAICRMYAEENKSVDEIREYLAKTHDIKASKSTLHLHLRRWGVSSKQRNNYRKDERLLARVRELWKLNYGQAEMLRILRDEDKFDVTNANLNHIRRRHQMLLRKTDPFGQLTVSTTAAGTTDPGAAAQQPAAQGAGAIVQSQGSHGVVKRGRARHSTRPDGRSSRFPSELTIDEAREVLGLDGEQQKVVISHAKTIFEKEAGGLTKTDIGPEKWQSMKAQLVTQNPHLRQLMRGSAGDVDSKSQALDIICSYAGKRLRQTSGRISLAEARVILGMDPQESRMSREQLFQILADKRFGRKADLAPGEWEEINKIWAGRCPKVKAALAVEPSDPKHERTTRALKWITKNITNRFQGKVGKMMKENIEGDREETRRPTVMPSLWQAFSGRGGGEGEQVEEPSAIDEEADNNWGGISPPDTFETNDTAANLTSEAETPQVRLRVPQTRQRTAKRSPQGGTQNFAQNQLQFLEPVSAPRSAGPIVNPQMIEPGAHDFGARFAGRYFAQQDLGHALPVGQQHQGQPNQSRAIAAFVRLNPASTPSSNGPNLWVATMQSVSVAEVYRIASHRYPGARCSVIEGIVKDISGVELPLRINQDIELEAYLEHLDGTAPTFSLLLH